MTNAEKYLKDEVTAKEFVNNFVKYRICHKGTFSASTIFEFLREQVTPTLTEDERVILRNIKDGYKYIYRTEEGHLMLGNVPFGTKATYVSTRNISQYKHLFQFIKERRRI